jgi:arabinofuranosyltransferase
MNTARIKNNSYTKAIITLLLVVFLYVLIRTAWVGDDAFITLRTVDNFINGYGLVWNIGEKVQTYTHPLWMLVLSGVYFFTHEAFFTTITVSILLSLAVIYTLCD